MDKDIKLISLLEDWLHKRTCGRDYQEIKSMGKYAESTLDNALSIYQMLKIAGIEIQSGIKDDCERLIKERGF